MNFVIQLSYFAAAFLFIFGLKRMSSPVTARSGIVWAGVGRTHALSPGLREVLNMSSIRSVTT